MPFGIAPTRYDAANVTEAVKLAQEFRRDRKYDWFRGQTNEYPPYPSQVRLQLKNDEESLAWHYERLAMVGQWLQKIPQLSYLLQPEYMHDFFAILQHYGIATGYLDFTTNAAVAGFFASDGPNIEVGRMCTIYCLNSADLAQEWSFISQVDDRKKAALELVRVDVRNLWRLQAQEGVFLYVNYNWDVDYPLDRIAFPYSGYPERPTKDEMYPQHRSPLEQLLDQYFERERATLTERDMLSMHQGLVASGASSAFLRMKSHPIGIYADAFHDPDTLSSPAEWPAAEWQVDAEERFADTVGTSEVLDGGGESSPNAFASALAKQVREHLERSPGLRQRAVDWHVRSPPPGIDVGRLEAMTRRAFNGMRYLPYSGEDIAACIGRVALLIAVGFDREPLYTNRRDLLVEHFGGEVMNVAFGTTDGAGSAGLATTASMRQAVRSDIASLLKDEYVKHVADLNMLFQLIYNPRLLFLFEPFKELFARELIPIQVADQRELIHFNPAALASFGNA